MNTIFIDFDGVMHPVSAIAGLSPYQLHLEEEMKARNLFCWLPLLEELLREYEDVTLVVHSSWKQYLTNEQMHAILGSLAGRFIGITPNSKGRYLGILDVVHRAAIVNHLILDDAMHEFPENHPELVLTHPAKGLNDKRVLQQVKDWLQKL